VSSNDLVFDRSTSQFFWGQGTSVMRGNADGTGTSTFVSTDGSTPVQRLALDPVGNTVYWANYSGTVKILRAPSTTGSPEVVATPPGLRGIAIDPRPGKRKLYYVDGGVINASPLDGTPSFTALPNALPGDIISIAVDTCANQFVAIGQTTPHPGVPSPFILSANLVDAGNQVTLFSGNSAIGCDNPVDAGAGIVVDTNHGKIYWTTHDCSVNSQIRSGNRDGSGTPSTLITINSSSQWIRGVQYSAPASCAIECPTCNQVAFVRKWGVFGSDTGQFKYPTGVATDPAGNIYVAEQVNNRIQKFSSTGVYVTQWGTPGSGPGQFNRPYGVAADNFGYVYVTDADNHRVEKFTSAGVYVATWGTSGSGDGQFNTPALVTTDSAGDVYVADYGNNRIQRFTGTGTFVTKWGSLGTGNGQFTFPTGIAVDAAHNVYVSDYNNHRIEKFTDTGTYLAQWGAFGTGNGQFNSPAGVATDCRGNVYVSDLGNQRVQVFSGSGAYINQWGTFGTGDGQFDTPIGVATDFAGNVYVADSHNHRMQTFACSSSPVSVGDGPFLVRESLLSMPNPFTRSTQIAMTIVRALSNANVSVLDVSGRVVRTLHRGPLAAGTRRFTWDGNDDQGRQVGSGLYFVTVRSAGGSLARKMIRVH
jgi:hypothetical protein